MQLLLRRGANPNVCSVPMPALVFTIKAGDMQATKLLLLKGADANLRLPNKVGGDVIGLWENECISLSVLSVARVQSPTGMVYSKGLSS